MASSALIEKNKQFLTDLFGGGEFRGHGITINPPVPAPPGPDDYTCSRQPLDDWADWIVREYETRLRWLELLEHDAVPSANMMTGTQIFAAAFGCPVHILADNKPFALPLVATAEDADHLSAPGLNSAPIDRVFCLARLLRERLGPEVPIGVPDIQSPFDIAALIWRKQDMFVAMYDTPDAVKRLVAECHRLLADFLTEYQREFAPVNLIHWPHAWAPAYLGCSLSEDEAGSLSQPMFEEFCLPSIVALSERFGGVFVHCCANADRLYGSFKKIPKLRGLNRVFQSPGPLPAIQAFSGQTVLLVSTLDEEEVVAMVQMALPETRLYFNMADQPIDEARVIFDRLRLLCPRLVG